MLEFNTGAPRIAAFWSDLEQQPATPWQVVRYTIDPAPPGGQPPFVQADWINIPDWGGGSQFFHTFSATIDALGVCKLSYQSLTSPSVYALLCGIGPGLGVNPQAAKDLSALHSTGYAGASLESFFEVYPGPGPGGGWPNPFDLFGQVLTFQPSAGGSAPASTVSYMLY